MAVTIPSVPHCTPPDAIVLGSTIYADGTVTSGTAGDAAPATWQEVAEDLNHVYAVSPMCLLSWASKAAANDVRCATNEGTLFAARVRIPAGYTSARLSTYGREDGGSGDTLTVRLYDGASVVATTTHTTGSNDAQSATGSLAGTGVRTLIVTGQMSAGTGYLNMLHVELVAVAAGSIP